MAIKIKKPGRIGNIVQYKSSKKILTPRDVQEADKLDTDLDRTIKKIEKVLVDEGLFSVRGEKSVKAWYLIGTYINKFLASRQLSKEDQDIFWDHLYGKSSLINKEFPKTKISKTRNDFRMASLLARLPVKKISDIKLWAIWREVLSYKACRDKRVLDFIVAELKAYPPRTRNETRPFLMAVSSRLRNIDTSVLSERELLQKLTDTLPPRLRRSLRY